MVTVEIEHLVERKMKMKMKTEAFGLVKTPRGVFCFASSYSVIFPVEFYKKYGESEDGSEVWVSQSFTSFHLPGLQSTFD